jgi:hypothetical protein
MPLFEQALQRDDGFERSRAGSLAPGVRRSANGSPTARVVALRFEPPAWLPRRRV